MPKAILLWLRTNPNLGFWAEWSHLGAMFSSRHKKAERNTAHKSFDLGQLKRNIFNQFLWVRNFSISFTENCYVSYCCYTWNVISFKCDCCDLLHRALSKILFCFFFPPGSMNIERLYCLLLDFCHWALAIHHPLITHSYRLEKAPTCFDWIVFNYLIIPVHNRNRGAVNYPTTASPVLGAKPGPSTYSKCRMNACNTWCEAELSKYQSTCLLITEVPKTRKDKIFPQGGCPAVCVPITWLDFSEDRAISESTALWSKELGNWLGRSPDRKWGSVVPTAGRRKGAKSVDCSQRIGTFLYDVASH